MGKNEILEKLIGLSRELGNKENDLAIIGEGNTSARIDDNSFYVKASGTQLGTLKEEGLVELRFKEILDLLKLKEGGDDDVKAAYQKAKVNPEQAARPSVETLLHAICLQYEGVDFIGHTHPTEINKLTCAKTYPEPLRGRLYPDEIVVLGRDSVFIPYTDPGLILASTVKNAIDEYISTYGEIPKVIYMQNHGFIALGSSPSEVINIHLTAVKAARIRIGALLCGGIVCLDNSQIERIIGRPDEKYRQSLFKNK